jgi:hypothetical protein
VPDSRPVLETYREPHRPLRREALRSSSGIVLLLIGVGVKDDQGVANRSD